MPPKIIRLIGAALSVLALISFVWLYGSVIVDVLKARKSGTAAPSPTPNVVYTATALAGLVGGFVASAFGQKLPTGPSRLRRFFVAGSKTIGSTATGSSSNSPSAGNLGWSVHQIIGLAYIILYFFVGIAAAWIWIRESQTSLTPDMLKNLALIVLGLMIAIAGAYIRPQQP